MRNQKPTISIAGLRKRAKLWMLIVLIAFVGLIVLEWGADILGRPGRGTEINILAKIGNKEITHEDFQRFFQKKLNEIQREKKHLTEGDYQQIKNEAWEELIRTIAILNTAEREKVQVSEEELFEVIKSNPPPEIQKLEELQTNNQFDYSKYLQALANEANLPFIMSLAEQLRIPLIHEKLRHGAWNCYRITDLELRDMIYKSTTDLYTEALFINYLPDFKDTVVSEDELRNYYKKHRIKFKTQEGRELVTVFFPYLPSPQDTLEAKERIEEAYSYLEEGSDFLELAKVYSDISTDTIKRKADGIYGKEKEILLSLSPGEYSKPIQTYEGWEILKLIKKEKDVYYYFKIFAKIKPSVETRDRIFDQIQDFIQRFIQEKVALDELVKNYNTQVLPGSVIYKDRPLPFIEYEKALKTWAFKAKKGDISFPYSDPRGFSVFVLKDIIPSHIPSFNEVREEIKREIIRERAKEKLYEFALELKKELMKGSTLSELHKKYPFLRYDTLNFPNFWLAAGSYGPHFAGILFALEPGESYGPMALERSYVFVRCIKKDTLEQKPEKIYRDRLTFCVNALANEVFKLPEIEDYRNAFNY